MKEFITDNEDDRYMDVDKKFMADNPNVDVYIRPPISGHEISQGVDSVIVCRGNGNYRVRFLGIDLKIAVIDIDNEVSKENAESIIAQGDEIVRGALRMVKKIGNGAYEITKKDTVH